MEDVYVTVDLTEAQYDKLMEFLGEQPIDSGFGEIYDLLLKAVDEDEEE